MGGGIQSDERGCGVSDKPAINTSERLFDLVRYMRAGLHEADLISDEEYFWLCAEAPMANSPKGGSPSRERLEEYDEMRERIQSLRTEAVERGFAEWVPDKEGNTTFKWKEVAK
jgi:hypothetical protein